MWSVLERRFFLRPPMDVSTERAKQNAILVNKKVKR